MAAASAPTEGYGGQYWDYATGYTQKHLTIPPKVPKEYTELGFDEAGDHFIFWKFGPETRKEGTREVETIGQLRGIRYPVGFHRLDKDDSFGRGMGYIPLLAFISAYDEIKAAIMMIYKNVIQNQNSIRVKTEETTREDGTRLITYQVQHIQLGGWQRFILLLNALGVMLRGLVTAGQVGIIFAPFDMMC